MDQLFLTSVMMSLIVSAFLLHRKFKGERFSRKVYYILWIVIAVRLILPFDISINNPVYRFSGKFDNSIYKQNNISAHFSESDNLNMNKIKNIKTEDNKLNEIKAENNRIKNNKNEAVNLSSEDKIIALKDKLTNILTVLNENIFNIWFAGALLYLLYNLITYSVFKLNLKKSMYPADGLLEEKLNKLKSAMNINKGISLKISSMVDSPMIAGLIKPVLLIPKDIDLENIDYIFSHELVHLKRRDILYKAVIFLATSVHWFNPIVHLMLKVAGEDFELSCDEEVVKEMSRDQRIIYSKTLIGAISRKRSPVCTTNFSGGAKMIKKRIDGIFASAKKKSSKPLIFILVIAMLTSSFLIGCDSKKEEEDLADKLYKNKTEFIGDNSKVSAIAGSLEYPEGYEYDYIEIYSKDEENGTGLNQLTIMFKEDKTRKNWADETEFMSQSSVLFSLIDNLDMVVYTTQDGEGNTAFAGFKRDNADSFTISVLGMKTKELGSSKDKFKKLVDYYQEYEKNLGDNETDSDDKIDQEEDINNIGNITNSIGELTLDIKYGNATPEGLTLIIENNSEKDYSTDGDFILYKKLRENEWEELADFTNSETEDDNPDIKEDNIKDLEAVKIKAKGQLQQYVQWDSLGKLDDGEYGIIKKILNKESENNYVTYSIGQTFEIRSGSLKPIEQGTPSGELELDETINSLYGVKMTAKAETINEKGLTLILENKSDLEYIFSEDFFIQMKTEGGWQDVKPLLKEGQYGFHDIALMMPAHGSNGWAVDWNWLYGSLERGSYRIVKEVIEDSAPGEIKVHYMGAEFEIE